LRDAVYHSTVKRPRCRRSNKPSDHSTTNRRSSARRARGMTEDAGCWPSPFSDAGNVIRRGWPAPNAPGARAPLSTLQASPPPSGAPARRALRSPRLPLANLHLRSYRAACTDAVLFGRPEKSRDRDAPRFLRKYLRFLPIC